MKRPAVVFAALALSAMAPVVGAQPAGVSPSGTLRFGATVGIDLWSDLGDLDPVPGGDFDEAGFGLDLNLHFGGWSAGPAQIYLGGDFGVIGHDSDVEGVFEREDLETTLVYITPSVKAVFGEAGRTHWTLDAGIGYYDVSIEEWEDDCFWDCDTWEYYDDSSVGGYLGLGLEFPLGGDFATRLLTAIKVHFVDFDDPVTLAPGGSLDGPIYVMYFGISFYR